MSSTTVARESSSRSTVTEPAVHTSSPCTELWADVPDHPGYKCSNWGRVKSRWRKHGRRSVLSSSYRLLNQHRNDKGYLSVTLRDGSRHGRTVGVARLVLTVFVRPGRPGEEARHLNGINTDNRLTNLAWGTPEENAEDKRLHGKVPRKPTVEQVRAIRASQAPLGELVQVYGFTYDVIRNIRTLRTYKRV